MTEEKKDSQLWSEKLTPKAPEKQTQSTAKRVAMFIFAGAGALATLVTVAIMDADTGGAAKSSQTPVEIVEASKRATEIIPSNLPAVEVALEPEPEPEQPEQSEPTPPAQPVYVPAPVRRPKRKLITDNRRTHYEQVRQAAASNSNIMTANSNNSQENQNPASALQALENAANSLNPAAPNTENPMNDAMSALQEDPNGWAHKDSFLKQSLPAEYSQHTVNAPVSRYELKSGAFLPCVMISGLNTDLPGNIIGQITENVWDTATGKFLLIPKGARLIGKYDNQVSFGQSRVLVVWQRLIFPDGSSLVLDNLSGVDQSGYTGLKGSVNRHFNSMLASALLVSLIGSGVQAISDHYDNNSSNNNKTDIRSILAENTANAAAQVLTDLVRQQTQRQPTIKIKPGYRFMIFVQHDIVFPRVWS